MVRFAKAYSNNAGYLYIVPGTYLGKIQPGEWFINNTADEYANLILADGLLELMYVIIFTKREGSDDRSSASCPYGWAR